MNVEGKYGGIRRTLRNAAMKNHLILRRFSHFLPEESNKLGCHDGVTLTQTHDINFSHCGPYTYGLIFSTLHFPTKNVTHWVSAPVAGVLSACNV